MGRTIEVKTANQNWKENRHNEKALLFGLSAAMLLGLVLVASNKPQADNPNEPDPTPSAVQTEPVETPEPEETTTPINRVEQMSVSTTQKEVDTRRLLTDEELLKIFQSSYDFGQIFVNEGFSEEDVLEQEFVELHCLVGMLDNVKAPDDLEDQYMAWRATIQDPQTSQQTQVTQQQTQTTNTTGGSTTTTTQPSGDTGGTGGPGGTENDLVMSVEGTLDPNAFLNIDDSEAQKAIDESDGFLDMSKVKFGN